MEALSRRFPAEELARDLGRRTGCGAAGRQEGEHRQERPPRSPGERQATALGNGQSCGKINKEQANGLEAARSERGGGMGRITWQTTARERPQRNNPDGMERTLYLLKRADAAETLGSESNVRSRAGEAEGISQADGVTY